jgi:hypothetical protein
LDVKEIAVERGGGHLDAHATVVFIVADHAEVRAPLTLAQTAYLHERTA